MASEPASQTNAEEIAPLLRLGLKDEPDSAAMTLDATIRVDAPTPRTGSGATGGSSRGWNPPSVEELQKVLPQYEVSAFIARGGMGAVYKGVQRALKRPVAIKVLPPEMAAGDDLNFADRFKREAQAMARLSHPNIVAVFDAGETPDGLLYFVMEFIEGTDVAQLIASEGQIDARRAVQITSAVCEALAFAHEEGIVHRDIKPSNIMIDKRGRVKVADFGLAKVTSTDATLVTQSNVAMGTPDFIAPEALIPGMAVDGRADLYAVGVMLYQMLTGAIPRGRFTLPSGLVPQVDKRFDPIVDKAMQTDREQRYSTATEMKKDVESVVMEKDGSAGDYSRTSSSGGADSAKKAGQLRSRVANVRTPRLLAAAGVLMLGAGAWFLLKPPAQTTNNDALSKTDAPSSSAAAELPKEWLDGTQALREAGLKAGKLKEEDGWLRATQEDFYFKLNEGRESEDMAVRLVFEGRIGTHLRKQYSMGNLTGYVSEVVGRDAKVVAKQIGRPDRLSVVNLPQPPPAKKDREMIFVVRGSVMSQWVDGKLVNTIRDEQHKRGWTEFKLFAASNNLPPTRLRKVEYAIWPSSSPDNTDVPSSSAAHLPTEWIDSTHELREAGLSAGKLKVEDGLLKLTDGNFYFHLHQRQALEHVALRVTFSGSIGMKLRKQDEAAGFAGYVTGVSENQATIAIAGKDNKEERKSVVDLPPQPPGKNEREMIFIVRGSEISQWLDGKRVNTLKDEQYKRGIMELALVEANQGRRATQLRKVEYAILK